MGYKYRNDETPDHVDSSHSTADYPHVGIPIAKPDATVVNTGLKGKENSYDSLYDRTSKDLVDSKSELLKGNANKADSLVNSAKAKVDSLVDVRNKQNSIPLKNFESKP